MSLTRKALTAAKTDGKPKRQDLVQALAERDAELAEARRENTRLFDELQMKSRDLEEALEQQAATGDVLKIISRSPALALPEVLQVLIVSAVKLCADDGVIYLKRGDVFVAEADFEGDAKKINARNLTPRRPGRGSVTGRVALSGQVEQIPDNLADPEFTVAPALRLKGIRSILGVPLLRGGEVAGVFVLGRREPGPFSDRAVEQARTFADQAVIATENARLFNEVQDKTRGLEESLAQQTATADVLKAISRTAFDLDTVLETLITTASRLCDARHGQIFRRHGDAYRYAASQMEVAPAYLQHEQAAEIRPGRGTLVGRVALENRTVEIADAWNDPEYAEKEEVRQSNLRAMLGVPLMRDGEPIGAFALARNEPIPFTPRQVELVTIFADQAVIAIENVRLFDEVQAKTRDLEELLDRQTATSEILRVISQSPTDAGPVFDRIVTTAARLLHYDYAYVILTDGKQWRPVAGATPGGARPERLPDQYPVNPSADFPSRAIASKAMVHLPDWSLIDLPAIESQVRDILGAQSSLYLPFLRDSECVGLLAFVSRRAHAFGPAEIAQAELFRDQALIAIENARLFNETQESLAQQTATADVLKVISRSAFDLQAVFDTLIASAVELSGSHSGAICVRDGEVFRYRSSSGPGASSELHNYLVEHPANPGRESIVGRAVLSRQIEQIPDIREDSEYSVPINTRGNPARGLVGVPLLGKDRVEGAIVLTRLEPGAFPKRQIEILQTFADQAVIAIENARLFDEVQAKTRDLEESLQQQTATADVLKVISRSAFDLDTVLKTLADSAQSLSGATGVLVLLRDGEFVRLRAESGCTPQHREYVAAHPFRPGRETVTGRVLITGEAVHIPDVLADPDYEYGIGPQVGNYRATFGAPSIRNGIVDGVFTLLRPEPGAFTPRQIELVRTFADQAVIAIENTRLFDEVQAKTRDLQASLEQQTATADVLKVISRSAFDLQAVFDTLISSAIALIGADQGSLWMRDGDLFRFRAYHGHSPDYVAWVEDHPLRAGRSSSVGRVAMTKQAALIPDVLKDLEYTPPANAMMGVRSVLAAPLLRHGEVEGVFVIFRKVPGDFSQRQIELVQTFADQAMIAIENVRLFDEVQAKTRDLEESLQQQTATADVLKVISRSAFDLPAVLRTLVESAAKLCDADKATITREINGVYYRAESYGFSEEFMGQVRNIPVAPERGSITGLAMLEGKAIQVEDVEADPEYWPKNFAKPGELRTGLGIPMMRNGAPIGVLALMRTKVRPFNAKQIELVQTFADQAVIAIENARLFDEVQHKTRDLEEALQQQTATADVLKVISRSAFDLQAVLTTLAELARELCGASFATLFMRERDADEMRLRAELGCTPEIVAFLHAHPIRAGRETFTGRVMLSGETVHLPDVLADPEYDFGDAPRIGNYRTLLGVPLLRDGQVEGVFALARPKPAPFTARQIEMVRAFADQAVIAIENSRLFEEVQARTRELAASLDDLRKAQDRLIQSEKLASLGQLTAGIAHEIKNPLNFINNYSALSRELVDELADAIKGAAVNEAAHGEADELIGAIGGNLDKIVQHGKRADSIVKNMLLHSREGSGERSTTNINTMVEEALNLAYHGARAEKPGFNVTIVKSLDPNAGAADVYPQEITRVLLNLISNGFYATSKRKQSAADGAYEPTISASTRDLGPKVEIAIRDNGTGIPDEVKAKMFNPFFTTKPAGEGTGLGLSLSHDIVVKQHGGAIEVSSEPDAFTEFTIVLPRGAVAL